MKVLDIVNQPWAIMPEKLAELRDIYVTHLRGEKINIKGIEAQLGRPLKNVQQRLDVFDGVAVIPVEGVLAKKMNLFSEISGGASTELIENDVRTAINSREVHSIILSIDSPGGSVDGTQELANIVRGAAEDKPVVTFASGLMASAAFWIGSAANKLFISGDTTGVGSIGVVATHVDISRAEDRIGIKTTEIVAGKFKRIASQHAPLSEEGRASIQAQVDHLYSVFVSDVALNRDVSVDEVLSRMADGRLFLGQQAIEAGLVDGVSTLESLIARLRDGDESLSSRGAGVAPEMVETVELSDVEIDALTIALDPNEQQETNEMEMSEMTIDVVRSERPDIADALRAEGATDERERIQSVEAQLVLGHEALIEGLKFDGKTTGPEAAVQVLAADKANRQVTAQALHDDAPGALPQSEPEDTSSVDSLPVDERCKVKWDSDRELRAEFGEFKRYLAFERQAERAAAGG